MGLIKPLLISVVLIFIFSLFGIFIVKAEFRSCEKFELNILQNTLVCGRVQGTEIDGQGNLITSGNYVRNEFSIIELYFIPYIAISLLIVIITFYFYFCRLKHFTLLIDYIDWKSWHYWLKVGIIGLILSALLQLIPLTGWLIRIPVGWLLFFTLPPFFGHNQISDSTSDIITISSSLIFYFLIGALIGFIFGKIKSRSI